VCATTQPPWQQAEDGKSYRCHIAPAELLRMQTEKGVVDSATVEPQTD
jgi:hypothetical protein